MRKFMLVVALAFVLFLTLAVALPFLVDLNKYQDHYRPLIEEALNRKVTFSDIRLTVIPRLGARVAGFTVMDDPGFNAGPFASLSSLDIGIKFLPLLSGRIDVEELTLRDPVITVIKNEQGVTNVSTLGKPRPAAPPPEGKPAPSEGPLKALALLAVDDLAISGGRLAYEDHSTKKPAEYRINDLALHLESFRLGATPRLHLSATVQPYNLPVTIDGAFGPLTETLDMQTIVLEIAAGKTVMDVKGSAVGGTFTLALAAPLINSADLPITLPLTKPVHVKDLRMAATGRYVLKEGEQFLDAVDVKSLELNLVSGQSVVALKGQAASGTAKITATSAAVDSGDVPVRLPLTKPVQIKNLQATVQGHYPPKAGVPPLELADVTSLSLDLVAGSSIVAVKGSGVAGEIKVTASSPNINTADLPVAVPLKKPIDIKDLKLAAGLKGQDARIHNLSARVLDGQVTSHGQLTIGEKSPPFGGDLTLQGVQLGPVLSLFSDTVSLTGSAAGQFVLQGRGFTMPELTKALTGTGHFTIKDGTIEGVNLLQEALALLKAAGIQVDQTKATVFSTIEGDLSVQQGVAVIQKLVMDSHEYQAKAAGTIGFDQSLNLKVNLALAEALSKRIVTATPAARLTMSGSRLTVPLIIGGTVRAPTYGLDLKAMGTKVQEQVKEQVREQLQETIEDLREGKKLDLKKGAERLKKLFGQ